MCASRNPVGCVFVCCVSECTHNDAPGSWLFLVIEARGGTLIRLFFYGCFFGRLTEEDASELGVLIVVIVRSRPKLKGFRFYGFIGSCERDEYSS